jgi:hypothetical protein
MDYVKYQIEYSRSLLLPPNINTIADYMRLYGASDWQPKMPEGAANLRLTENMLPTSPDTGASPKVVTPASSPSKVQCPPGTQAGLGGTRAGVAASLGCIAIQKIQKK